MPEFFTTKFLKHVAHCIARPYPALPRSKRVGGHKWTGGTPSFCASPVCFYANRQNHAVQIALKSHHHPPTGYRLAHTEHALPRIEVHLVTFPQVSLCHSTE